MKKKKIENEMFEDGPVDKQNAYQETKLVRWCVTVRFPLRKDNTVALKLLNQFVRDLGGKIVGDTDPVATLVDFPATVSLTKLKEVAGESLIVEKLVAIYPLKRQKQ